MVHALCDERCKIAREALTVWVDNRAQMDDRLQRCKQPWRVVADVFNDCMFQPENFFLDRYEGCEELLELDPGLPPAEKRSDSTLSGMSLMSLILQGDTGE